MEMEKFIKNLAEQFDEIESSELTAKSNFRDNDDWSSIVALSVIAMIDEEYDVTLKGDDIQNSNTIEDLFNLTKSKL